jgi:CheY-like chemotaxis protein
MSAIHGIIKSHNGILQLTSRPGVGTTFKVYFPVPDASEYEDSAFSAPDLFETADGTILLVEDEKTLRTMGSTLLETMGFSVLTAQHGCEALDICREHLNEIDVILLDLIMPVMGGLETYRALRSIAPALPIIICSGYGVELVDDVIKNDRHAGFMHKPYKPEELRRVIMEMKA